MISAAVVFLSLKDQKIDRKALAGISSESLIVRQTVTAIYTRF
jgi:hypothetical protein